MGMLFTKTMVLFTYEELLGGLHKDWFSTNIRWCHAVNIIYALLLIGLLWANELASLGQNFNPAILIVSSLINVSSDIWMLVMAVIRIKKTHRAGGKKVKKVVAFGFAVL